MDNLTNQKKLISDILKLKAEREAVILAHNYQRDEVQEIADFTGDSLGLSIEAMKTNKKTIVFCGVHFMAETAAILSPEKTVILPRMEAGCPMADMITPEALIAKKKELGGDVTVVCYVNSSAAVKAISDICCTSANAVQVVKSLGDAKVLMVPDMNLAKYTAAKSGKNLLWWDGYCPTHHLLKLSEVYDMKKKYPSAKFVAHPECPPEILKEADHICSTSGMYKFCKESDCKEFIIGTEMGILYKLRKENPSKTFHLASKSLVCPNMKITRLVDVYTALNEMKNIITVPEEIRGKARLALERMINIPRDY